MPCAPDLVRPGYHSHNASRLATREGSRPDARLHRIKRFLLVAGLICVGFYLYTLGNQYVYQAYENWAFDQEISGRTGVTFTEYVKEKIPDGLWPAAKPLTVTAPSLSQTAPVDTTPRLAEGDLVARVSIPRLDLSAIVREGVSARTLSTSVGHIPATALPGNIGNFAIAAHRDTLFRALKDIRLGDQVTVESRSRRYVYEVVATKIVRPSDVGVLRADGGGLYAAAAKGDGSERLLTMITCYPFYYVGSAPKRFVVESRLVSSSPLS